MLSYLWSVVWANGTDISKELQTTVPTTTARVLVDNHQDVDQSNVWFINRFVGHGPAKLRFEGLTAFAIVNLNHRHLFTADSMFLTYEMEVHLVGDNELSIYFYTPKNSSVPKLPRPRWRQQMISDLNLRAVRNTILGNMPGSCPEVKAIGPYRPITCKPINMAPVVSYFDIDYGILSDGSINVTMSVLAENFKTGVITIGDHVIPISNHIHVQYFDYVIEDPRLWYPHTHGEPNRYKVTATLDSIDIDLGFTAFRSLEKVADFQIKINGVNVFCRGACWVTMSIIDLSSTTQNYRKCLEMVRDCGINMIRIPGTSLYEVPEFYDLCDELGIMVWQDFMFANFDYPRTDEFTRLVSAEASQLIERTHHNACMTVFCGGSEVFQQAAMLGLMPEKYVHPLFTETLKHIVKAKRKDSIYIENSPYGGEWPFQTDVGSTHYYGYGAYLRDSSDIRRADVKFASECLAISNVPCYDTVREMNVPAVHHPKWKESVPRDNNVTWDFEDVRDHYLQSYFKVDPNFLRRTDKNRYLELSRAVSCILVTEVFSEWRKHKSKCGGGLILSLQDTRLGAGWGITDVNGLPKSIFYALKQMSQSIQVTITNEGLNGLDIHLINETANQVVGELTLTSYKDGIQISAVGSMQITLDARSTQKISSRELIQGFFDICYAYRFGPSVHNVSVVELTLNDGTKRQAFDFSLGHIFPQEDLGLEAEITKIDQRWYLTIKTKKFARLVHINISYFTAKDDWIDIAPNGSFVTELCCNDSSGRNPIGYVLALNSLTMIAVKAE